MSTVEICFHCGKSFYTVEQKSTVEPWKKMSTVEKYCPPRKIVYPSGNLCSTMENYVPLWIISFHRGILFSTVENYAPFYSRRWLESHGQA